MCLVGDAATLKTVASILGGGAFQIEEFLLLQKLCRGLQPVAGHMYRVHGQALQAQLQNKAHLVRLLDLAQKSEDASDMEVVVAVADAACKQLQGRVSLLDLATQCHEKGWTTGAASLALKAPSLGLSLDLLLKIAADGVAHFIPDLVRSAQTGGLDTAGIDKLIAYLATRPTEHAKEMAQLALISLKKITDPVKAGQMAIASRCIKMAINARDELALRAMVAELKSKTPNFAMVQKCAGPTNHYSRAVSPSSLLQGSMPPFNYEPCGRNVETVLQSWRRAQDELHQLVSEMVDYKPLAQQLLLWAEGWETRAAGAALLQFRATMTAWQKSKQGSCRTNHTQWRTLCQSCGTQSRNLLGLVAEYLHTVRCLGAAMNTAGNLVNSLVAAAGGSKFIFVERELTALVLGRVHAANTQVLQGVGLQPPPRFPGFVQPVLDVKTFEQQPRARICGKGLVVFSDQMHLSNKILDVETAESIGEVLAGTFADAFNDPDLGDAKIASLKESMKATISKICNDVDDPHIPIRLHF